MKSAGVIGLAAATVGAVVSCSSDTHPDATTATSETTGAVKEMDRAAVMARYHVDLNAFVAVFRARYPDLASDRNDASIKHVAIEPCIDLANGVDEQTVIATIAELAENRGTAPTTEQTQQIYPLVVPVFPCPLEDCGHSACSAPSQTLAGVGVRITSAQQESSGLGGR